ncbi:TolC family protein [Tautonia marina]|uniref:TolC family protein n=1 Tax=Tautonia marina TaxID=2653855 RepID=UPI0013759E85|nr:TolC family protein [Tautonia marina]
MTILWLAMVVVQVGPPIDLPPLPNARPMEVRTGPAVPAERHVLTVADLEQIALQSNPTLAQAAERIGQAQGNADQAGRYPNPIAVWNSQSLGAGGTMGTQGGFVQQPIVTGGKLRINRSRYEVDVEIARWGLVEQQYRVRNGVRLRSWQILAQQRLLEARAGLIRMADEVVALTRAKVDSGHASKADLLLAENDATAMRLDREQLEDRYQNSWRELAAYLGVPGMEPVPLAGDLERQAAPVSWEESLAYLLEGSPEVKIAELRVLRTQRDLRREEVEPIPDLILRGGAAHDLSNDDTIGIVRVYVDLPLWDRNQGNIARAHHALTDARQNLARVRLSIEQRLARRYNQYLTSNANVKRYQEEILPRSLQAFEIYGDEFRNEEASYSRVQSALGAYTDGLQKLFLEYEELRNAETAIEGMLLVEDIVESTTPRPPSGGLPQAPSGGGVPVGGRPSRDPN